MNIKYETERLILAVLNAKQAGPVTDFYNRNFEEFSRYEPLSEQARTLSYHKRNLQYEYNLYLKGQFIRYYIFEKHNPMTVIGTVSYRDIRRDFYDCCTIGYKMDASKRRRGYAREAIHFLDGQIFSDMRLNRIEATIRPENIPSMRLLESIGYVDEGILREKIRLDGIYTDHHLYSLLKRDYR